MMGACLFIYYLYARTCYTTLCINLIKILIKRVTQFVMISAINRNAFMIRKPSCFYLQSSLVCLKHNIISFYVIKESVTMNDIIHVNFHTMIKHMEMMIFLLKICSRIQMFENKASL